MQKFDTAAPISAFLEIQGGSIRLVAGDRADTTVVVLPADASKSRDVRLAEQTTVEYADGILRIQASAKKSSQILGPSGAIDVTVELPAGSDVRVKAAAAALRGAGRLGDVAFDGAYGAKEAVVLEEAANISVTAYAGDVSVGRLGGSAQITTTKGDVSIAEAVSGTLELCTQVGDVSVDAAPAVSAVLDAGTGYGRIRNSLRNTEGAAAGLTIHATTGHGDITARSL